VGGLGIGAGNCAFHPLIRRRLYHGRDRRAFERCRHSAVDSHSPFSGLLGRSISLNGCRVSRSAGGGVCVHHPRHHGGHRLDRLLCGRLRFGWSRFKRRNHAEADSFYNADGGHRDDCRSGQESNSGARRSYLLRPSL
jgi:hypothetical protein